MPLDPNIILANADPSRQFNPMQAMGNALQMKALAQNVAMGGMKQQQVAMSLQDQQTLRKLAQSGQYQDPDSLANAAMESGVSPQTVMALKMQGADYQNKVAGTAQALATAAQRGGAAQADKIKMITQGAQEGRALALTAQTPDQWAAGLQNLDAKYGPLGMPSFVQKYGDFTPQNRAILALNGQTMADASKQAFGENMSTPNGVVNIKQPQMPGQSPTVTQVTQGKPQPVMLPQGGTGFANVNPVTGKMEPVAGGMKPIPPAMVQMYGMNGGGSGNAPLSPQEQAVVQAIKDGRMASPGGFALKTPYWQNIMGHVMQEDPQWSEQRAQLRKAFTTGKQGQNVDALNTATAHLDDYLEAAQALKNGTFQPGNAVYNKISQIFGGTPPTTFDAFKNAVAGEQANALKGSATDQEIKHVLEVMSSSQSPDQFIQGGKAALTVMNQKLNTYGERYKQQNPGDTTWNPVLPTASAVFQKYGIGQRSTSSPSGEAQLPYAGKVLPQAVFNQLSADDKRKFISGGGRAQ